MQRTSASPQKNIYMQTHSFMLTALPSHLDHHRGLHLHCRCSQCGSLGGPQPSGQVPVWSAGFNYFVGESSQLHKKFLKAKTAV